MPPTPPERLHPGNRRFNATANWIMRALLIAFTRYRVEGRQHIPREGAFILAANHLSYTDPPTLAASARRHVIFMTKQEILRMPVLGLVARLYGSFGIRRGEADLSALRKAQGALNSSAVLGMFPEGTRARRRGLGRPHPGVALLALRTNALIVPAAIWGTQQILPRLPLVPFLRPRVTVRFGEPFRLPPVSRQHRGGSGAWRPVDHGADHPAASAGGAGRVRPLAACRGKATRSAAAVPERR